MIKLLKILGIVSISAMVWGMYARIDKDYGLRVHMSLGELCQSSVAIVIGEVISMEDKVTGYMDFCPTSKIVETGTRIRIWEDVKKRIVDSVVTVRLDKGLQNEAEFSVGETVFVFLEDTHRMWKEVVLLDLPDSNTLFVVGKEKGKFKVVNGSVRADRYYNTRNLGIELELAKDIARSAIKYPVTVDAKLDTLYEEANAMYSKLGKGYLEIKDYVYQKLEEIVELGK